MPNTKPPVTEVSATAFFNQAREYMHAANRLFDETKSNISNPINLLYFHAVELTLKAFLRSRGVTRRRKGREHELKELYDECRGLGLTIDPADQLDIENIVSLLESGNEDQGFRYFNLKSVVMADLSWTREVVEKLIRVVGPQVGVRLDQDIVPGVAVKGIMILGKPVPATSVEEPRLRFLGQEPG
jgi:HEPN domain-containing protein